VVLLFAIPQWSCMGACDLVVPTKHVAASYSLAQYEGRWFYLVKRSSEGTNADALAGMVDQLGWNGDYIVGYRQASTRTCRAG
jgi:hypothetical protein